MWNKIVAKNKKAFLWVVSGPSGSGKTTLCEKLIQHDKLNIARSVSFTTRSLRRGEKSKRDYFFISRQEFRKKIKAGDFLEWKEVFGNLYGTSKRKVRSLIRKNKDVLLCIDVQGALEIMHKFPKQAISIFVVPPNEKELERRTKLRDREKGRELKKRLDFAKTELSYAKKYDYVIVNDDLSEALKNLESIIIAKRLEK
jgi:guanylate kinase